MMPSTVRVWLGVVVPIPTLPIRVVSPSTVSGLVGDVVPTPTLPWLSMTKAVDVEFAVEVEIKNKGAVARERPSIERRAAGVVEAPIPRLPALLKIRAVEVAVPPEDEAMVKRGLVWRAVWTSVMERLPQGEVVPNPSLRFEGSKTKELSPVTAEVPDQ